LPEFNQPSLILFLAEEHMRSFSDFRTITFFPVVISLLVIIRRSRNTKDEIGVGVSVNNFRFFAARLFAIHWALARSSSRNLASLSPDIQEWRWSHPLKSCSSVLVPWVVSLAYSLFGVHIKYRLLPPHLLPSSSINLL